MGKRALSAAVALTALALAGPACGVTSAEDTVATGAGSPGPTAGEPASPVGDPGWAVAESDVFPGAGDGAPLADVRVTTHDGFDRVVIELSGEGAPGFRVVPVGTPPALESGGRPVPIAGRAFLDVRLAPATLYTAAGARAYAGPDRVAVPDGGVVAEVVRTGGTDGPLSFAVGLDRPAPFAVELLADPARLVVDVDHGA